MQETNTFTATKLSSEQVVQAYNTLFNQCVQPKSFNFEYYMSGYNDRICIKLPSPPGIHVTDETVANKADLLSNVRGLHLQSILRIVLDQKLVDLSQSLIDLENGYQEDRDFESFREGEERDNVMMLTELITNCRKVLNLDPENSEHVLETIEEVFGGLKELSADRIEWIKVCVKKIQEVRKMSEAEKSIMVDAYSRNNEKTLWKNDYLLDMCSLRSLGKFWENEIRVSTKIKCLNYKNEELKKVKSRIADIEAVLKNKELKIGKIALSEYSGGIRVDVLK